MWKFIDLFSGIGGIRLGFEQAGKFKCAMSCEIDADAATTYMNNLGDDPTGDVTKIAPANLPKFDVLAAGFPCQAFSMAGFRLGFADATKGTLFFDVARIIEARRPKMVFLENVKGLVNHDDGKTFRVVTRTLEELGYHVYHKVISAIDHGLPQKRERIYIVGINARDLGMPSAEDWQLSEACGDGYVPAFKFPEPSGCAIRVKNILEPHVSADKFLSAQYMNGLVRHKQKQGAAGRGFGYEIVDIDGYANTIVCGGMGRERNLVVDHNIPSPYPSDRNDRHVRMMTPREWARLQGFPEGFKLPKNDSLAYKQLGNSVAIPVVRAIAVEMAKTLDALWGAK